MQWEPTAQARLEKVPFFIRKKVKKQIEDYVQQQGGQVVTSEDVTTARQALVGVAGSGSSPAGAVSLPNAGGSLTAEELDRIENVIARGVDLEGLKTRYHEVKVCGGAAGCPLTLINDRAIAHALARVLDDTGLDSYLAGQIEGPVLFHHKFKVAIAGCPNSCSQPQIVDFGVSGQSRPGRGEADCSNCGLCLRTCKEKALHLTAAGPVFDYTRCLYCGDCIRACPRGAIQEEKAGYRVLVGGKLGRHPHLAEAILELVDERQLLAALQGTIQFFVDHGRHGERFAGLVERLGIDRLRKYILATSNDVMG